MELFALEVVVVTEVIVVVSILLVGKTVEPSAMPMTSMMTATPTNDRIVEGFGNN